MKKLFFLITLITFFASVFAIEKPKLYDFAFRKYSQDGEDGMIQKIFEIIGAKSKVCIEFGAWDGFYLSNTALLWSEYGWNGVLIEANEKSFQLLLEKVAKYNCYKILAYVESYGENHLENVLKKNNIKQEIDLLSIDIDGNDYYIWKSLNTLRPRVVVCEFNPTIPLHMDIYGEYNDSLGCSVGALVKLAKEKKYRLIGLTLCNAFFVVEEEYHKFQEFETDLEKIKTNKCIKYLFTDFLGNYVIIGETNIIPFGINNKYNKKINGTDIDKIIR